jgi:hypothetical protein
VGELHPRVVRVQRILASARSLESRFAQTLALLKQQDLYPAWRCVDVMERMGEMSPKEAVRWKHGIFGLMERWGLEPDDLVTTSASR